MPEYRAAIDIAASPDTVFEYLVTDDGMTAWMGQRAALDPVAGGDFAVDIAGHAIRGTFVEIDRPRRVVVTWGMGGSADLPPGSSTVTFDLIATPDGTRVELRHEGLPETEVPGHDDGWRHFLPRLERAAIGLPAGTDDWMPMPDRPAAPDRPDPFRSAGRT